MKLLKLIQMVKSTNISMETLAPFVLFDSVEAKTDSTWGFGWHPHSGFATLTYIHGAVLNHEDSASGSGRITAGGFKWMQAGSGIWHKEFYEPINGKARAHQLWVQLPPEVEEDDASYLDRNENEIPIVDNKIKVVVGKYKETDSQVKIPADMTYLDVELDAGKELELQLQDHQRRGILFPREGSLNIEGQELESNEFAILSEDGGNLKVKAISKTKFILATIVPSSYPMVASRGQIHTIKDTLTRSFNRIQELREKILK